jgi:hypothetical protein
MGLVRAYLIAIYKASARYPEYMNRLIEVRSTVLALHHGTQFFYRYASSLATCDGFSLTVKAR